MQQPLLEEEDKEAKPVPKPPGAPSLDLTATAEESISLGDGRTWGQWLRTSPVVPTACCIFLCFILKVVQQASPLIPFTFDLIPERCLSHSTGPEIAA